MSTVDEISRLEQELVRAELGPDASWFEAHLADDVVLDGSAGMKAKVVAAHRATGTAKFTHVEMADTRIVDHGDVAVVTCVGRYVGAQGPFALKFMRVWHKKNGAWRIVAATTAPG